MIVIIKGFIIDMVNNKYIFQAIFTSVIITIIIIIMIILLSLLYYCVTIIICIIHYNRGPLRARPGGRAREAGLAEGRGINYY